MKTEIKLRQVLYKPVYHKNNEPEIKEVVVTKIGRTYFYVNNNNDMPISLLDLIHRNKVYSQSNFTVYPNKQDIIDLWAKQTLQDKISKFFSWSGNYKELSLSQLKEIEKVIENNQNR